MSLSSRHWVQVIVLAAVLSACSSGGGDDTTNNPPPNTNTNTAVVDKPSVYLSGVGQTADLHAQILDATGGVLSETVTWVSSAPDKISVDANGRLQAVAIGSALIFAESNGVRSLPTLVFVAEPAPGALLVTDAQVVTVGPALNLDADGIPGVGTQYEVTLQDVDPPAPGTIVIAAETKPVAGKVIAMRAEASGIVVTLELVPLPELFAQYDINWNIDLSPYTIEPVTSAVVQAPQPAAGVAVREAASPIRPFEAFECDGSIGPQLIDKPLSLTVKNELKLIVDDRPGFKKRAVEGTFTLVSRASLKLKVGFKASGRCEAAGQIKLPVVGPASFIVMPAIRLGLGAELSGELLLVQGEVGVEGELGVTGVVGYQCSESATESVCEGLDAILPVNKLTPKDKFDFESDINTQQVKLSGQFYGLVGLDLPLFLGAVNAEILRARVGPKQSFDLATEGSQALRKDYASYYDLKLEGVVEPGRALKAAIGLLASNVLSDTAFKPKFSEPISESPKGSLDVSKTSAVPGDPVNFTVQLTPSTVNYFLIGHNVMGVELYRKAEGETEFRPFKSMELIASNSDTYHYRWTPEGIDAGKNEFAAFVNAQLPVGPLLEISPDTIKTVEIKCFGPSAQQKLQAAGVAAATLTCSDSWTGTSSMSTDSLISEASVTWVRDPSPEGASPLQVFYHAEGSVTFRYLLYENSGCTVEPSTFNIGAFPGDGNGLDVDYEFTPARFFGGGTVNREITITCPDRDPLTLPFGLTWFSGLGDISEDGLTIHGSTVRPQISWSFTFVRP